LKPIVQLRRIKTCFVFVFVKIIDCVRTNSPVEKD